MKSSTSKIHPTAIIESGAKVGNDVHIGPYSIVYSSARIGDRTLIGAHCEIGLPAGGFGQHNVEPPVLEVGEDSIIRSGTVIYAGSSFGPRLECGHKVTVRENTVAGVNLRLGTLTDIQGDCTFGNYSRMHGNVQIGKLSKIGNFCWVFPYVVFTNDPHPPSEHCLGVVMDDYAVVGAHTIVMPGVTLGRECVIGGGSLVSQDIPPGMLAMGHPAKPRAKASMLRDRADPAKRAYPWMSNFNRGMPWKDVGFENWLHLNQKIS
jgi:acyl-[acyl carrier protein]--UDP-N-acetylglucosamine O-acyltransferase